MPTVRLCIMAKVAMLPVECGLVGWPACACEDASLGDTLCPYEKNDDARIRL